MIPADRVSTPAFHARFWSNVDTSGGLDECWPWIGYRSRQNYGTLSVDCFPRRAHRILWKMLTGDDPPVVMHLCDNPPCCNPLHLWSGDWAENMRDRDRKGRGARGERAGNVRLTEDQVVEIKRMVRAGARHADVADAFAVCKATVSHIMAGRNWKHIP